jgi:hypothetical protein
MSRPSTPSPAAVQPAPRRAALLLLIAIAAAWAGWLAHHRVIQIDEIQTLHMSWLLGREDAGEYFNSAEPYMLSLAALSRATDDPFRFLQRARLAFAAALLGVFLLLLRGIRPDLAGAGPLAAAVLVVSVPVFWDYGPEVRHDNVVLFGLALMMALLLGPAGPPGQAALLASGAAAVGVQLSSHKAVLFLAPVLLGFLVRSDRRWRAAALLAAGAAAGAAAALGLYAATGTLPAFLQAWRFFFDTIGQDFLPIYLETFWLPFVLYHPWLLATTAAFAILYGLPAARAALGRRLDDRSARDLCILLPLLGCAVFVAANPTLFPYNFVFPALFMLFACARVCGGWWDRLPGRRAWLVLLVLALHVAPGLYRIQRHRHYTNEYQRRVMEWAHRVTGPDDCVFDGAGLALYRTGPGFYWYLHSLNMNRYFEHRLERVPAMLERCPCPILILNYRWMWLPGSELRWIMERYVQVNKVFWVMGRRWDVPAAGIYPFTVHKAGHYRVLVEGAGAAAPVLLDGTPAGEAPRFLASGDHALRLDGPAERLQVLWAGRDADSPWPPPDADRTVFLGWY